MDAPLLLALAIDVPEREPLLLRMVHDPAFTVGGRQCEVVKLCASIRDLEHVISSGAVDVVVVASQLGAIPFASLVALARRPTRMVITAPDPADERWDDFPGGLVVGEECSADLLALALAGDQTAVAHWRQSTPAASRSSLTRRPAVSSPASVAPTTAAEAKPTRRGKIIAVAGAYRPSGKSLVAVGLSRALGVRNRAVLVDADERIGTTPFTLGLSAGHSLCLLADKDLTSADAWDAALRAELQSMDEASQALVLAGVPRPSMRPRLTPAFYERLVHALAERFAFVVLDTSGGGWSAADSAIDCVSLRLADHILLVIRPDVPSLALAREALKEWSSNRERMGVVLNQAGQRGMEGRAEIEDVLGLGVVAVIPFDASGVAAATRRRRPIVCQHGARAAAPLLDLAARLQGGGPIVLPPDVEPTSTSTVWWRRLTPSGVGGLVRW